MIAFIEHALDMMEQCLTHLVNPPTTILAVLCQQMQEAKNNVSQDGIHYMNVCIQEYRPVLMAKMDTQFIKILRPVYY